MTFRSLGLLKVCMMTHRAPLSPPSTTHEPWPLIPHMWVWDAVAMATAVGTEAFTRCPWIVRVSSFESVCRCIMRMVVEGCERKCAVDASQGTQACIYLKTGCMYSSGACWVKRVFVWVKKISVAHLSSCLSSEPPLCHWTKFPHLVSPARKVNSDPRWTFRTETWKNYDYKWIKVLSSA